MLVVYVTFAIEGDRERFDRWFAPLAAATRAVPGCMLYDFLADPLDRQRAVIFEAWETAAERDAYLVTPHHVEMVAEGSRRYGMRDFRSYYWPDAGAASIGQRRRSDEPSAASSGGRDEMNRQVASRLAQERT